LLRRSDYNAPFPVNNANPIADKTRAMHIGPYQLKNNLIVAPMAGVTDRPFRQLCKTMGAGMAVSEMVASNSLLWGSAKTLRRANHDGEVDPISVQIAGADPGMLAEAARYNVARWVTCDEADGGERELKRFVDGNAHRVALDAVDAPCVLLEYAGELRAMQENWPKIKFHALREHAGLVFQKQLEG